MTVNALSRDPEYLFACGVAKYGDSNLVTSWALSEKRLRLYTEIFLCHPSEKLNDYLKGSPIGKTFEYKTYDDEPRCALAK